MFLPLWGSAEKLNFGCAKARVLFIFLCVIFAAGVFAPLHGAHAAFPTTGILDNFNRADENPLANGTWTCPAIAGSNSLKLVGNVAVPTVGAANNDCYWSAATFGPDVEAYATISTKPANGDCIDLETRLSEGGGPINGYAAEFCSSAGTDTWDLYRVDNSVFTHLGTTGNQELASGDSMGLEVIGNNIKFYYKPAAGSWTLEISASDSTYSGSGRIGLHVEDGAADDFGGGTVAWRGVQVSSRSDKLSNSQPSATSNHTFAFTVNNSIVGSSVSNSSTLILTLPSGFSIPAGMDCGDVDAATSSQFNFNYPVCQATATAWGFSATGSDIILVPPPIR